MEINKQRQRVEELSAQVVALRAEFDHYLARLDKDKKQLAEKDQTYSPSQPERLRLALRPKPRFLTPPY